MRIIPMAWRRRRAARRTAALADELADVLSYVIRLADVSDVDLTAAFLRKLQKNRDKYPADLVRGSAAKYTPPREAPPPLLRRAARAAEAAAEAREAAGGSGEWGTPDWVNAAYQRAAARVKAAEEGQQQEQAPPPPPPPPPMSGRGRAECHQRRKGGNELQSACGRARRGAAQTAAAG